jgi:hypothetical protein
MKVRAGLIVGAALVGALVAVWRVALSPTYNRGSVEGLYVYEWREVAKTIEASGHQASRCFFLRRNSAGTRIYLHDADPLVVLDSASKSVEVLKRPSRVSFLSDDGQWVAWADEKGMNLIRGDTVEAGDFDVDPSGRYYARRLDRASVEIGECRKARRGRIEESYQPARLFAQGDTLYLIAYDNSGPSDVKVRCDVLKDTGAGFTMEEQIDMGTLDLKHVVDMDTATRRVLLSTGGNPPWAARWYLFDLQARTLTSLGREANFGLFLHDDVVRMVSDATTSRVRAATR